MSYSIRKSPSGKIVLSILLLSVVLLGVGCSRAPTTGWSGPIVNNTVLYVGSIEGKVFALNLSNVTGSQPPIKWEQEFGTSKSGSLFACGAALSTPMSTYGIPAIGEDKKIYVGGYDGTLYSIRIDDRSMSEFDTGSAIVGSPKVANDLVFVGNSDGEFYALDLQLGLRWKFETGDKIWSTPEVDNGVVYIGSADHNLYAIDIETGTEIWHFEASGAFLSTPLVVDGTVYIGSCDNNFYAVDAATEEERLAALARDAETPPPSKEAKWTFPDAKNWFWTKALFYEDEIWVGCLDHKVYALNAETGTENWTFETEGMVQSPPVLMGDAIIIGSGSEEGEKKGRLYKIDPQAKSGRIFYSFDAPVLAPLYADNDNGIVYVHAQNGNHTLYAIRVETGEELWSFETS